MNFSGKVASGPMNKFQWRSGSRIRIATLVRRDLAEVCTVPVLLVDHVPKRQISEYVRLSVHPSRDGWTTRRTRWQKRAKTEHGMEWIGVCCVVQREGVGAESHVQSVLSAGRVEAAHDGEFDGGGDERRRAHPRPDRRLQRNALRVRDSHSSHARKPSLEVAPTTYLSTTNSTNTENTRRCCYRTARSELRKVLVLAPSVCGFLFV